MKNFKIKILFIMVITWLSFFIVDYILYLNNTRPIFSVPLVKYRDGGTVEYYGLGYKIIKYNTKSAKDKSIEFGSWFLKYKAESDYCSSAINCDECKDGIRMCHYYSPDMEISTDTIECSCK